MATVFFDSTYVPTGFLIVKKHGDPYKESDTVLISVDYDYPSVASRMGWSVAYVVPGYRHCVHRGTDGSVDCPKCGLTASDFINAAYNFIRDNRNKEFPELEEYFN